MVSALPPGGVLEVFRQQSGVGVRRQQAEQSVQSLLLRPGWPESREDGAKKEKNVGGRMFCNVGLNFFFLL